MQHLHCDKVPLKSNHTAVMNQMEVIHYGLAVGSKSTHCVCESSVSDTDLLSC